jgi:hypothetical protein
MQKPWTPTLSCMVMHLVVISLSCRNTIVFLQITRPVLQEAIPDIIFSLSTSGVPSQTLLDIGFFRTLGSAPLTITVQKPGLYLPYADSASAGTTTASDHRRHGDGWLSIHQDTSPIRLGCSHGSPNIEREVGLPFVDLGHIMRTPLFSWGQGYHQGAHSILSFMLPLHHIVVSWIYSWDLCSLRWSIISRGGPVAPI